VDLTNQQSNHAAGPDVPFGLRGRARLGFWLAVWTFLGTLQAMRLYIAYHSGGQQYISLAQAFTWALADWYIWGLLSPAIFALTRRTAFARGRRALDLATHLVAAPLFAAAQLFLYSLVYLPLGTLFWHDVGTSNEWTMWTLYLDLLHGKIHAGVITYFLLAFLYFTLYFNERYRQAEAHRARLSAQLATAQLNALKMQLHPHFLFNTLNAITALIHSAPETADRMTTRLGELLRLTLEMESVQQVPLSRELDFLGKYLEIQTLRFSDRLSFHANVDAQVRDALVPVLILQPLLENAVEHGVAPRAGDTRIELSARREGDRLVLSVVNPAPTEADSTRKRTSGGRGLANTRARLQELYGSDASLDLEAGREFRVTVRIPFRTESGHTG